MFVNGNVVVTNYNEFHTQYGILFSEVLPLKVLLTVVRRLTIPDIILRADTFSSKIQMFVFLYDFTRHFDIVVPYQVSWSLTSLPSQGKKSWHDLETQQNLWCIRLLDTFKRAHLPWAETRWNTPPLSAARSCNFPFKFYAWGALFERKSRATGEKCLVGQLHHQLKANLVMWSVKVWPV